MPKLSEQMDRGHGGYLLAIAPALFGVLGWWLDGLLGWSPVLTIVGVLYGLVGASYKVVASYRAEMNSQAAERRSGRPVSTASLSNVSASAGPTSAGKAASS